MLNILYEIIDTLLFTTIFCTLLKYLQIEICKRIRVKTNILFKVDCDILHKAQIETFTEIYGIAQSLLRSCHQIRHPIILNNPDPNGKILR